MLTAGATLAPAITLGWSVFSITVVGYTLLGGFLASVWTDLFQSVLMLLGVVVLLILAVPLAGGLEHATRAAIEQTGTGFRHQVRAMSRAGVRFCR